jgi:hypothetical protein
MDGGTSLLKISEVAMNMQLEWKEYPGSRLTGESKERYGFHEFGSYLITRDGGSYAVSTFSNMGQSRIVGEYKLLGEAKDAAQADFGKRVQSLVRDERLTAYCKMMDMLFAEGILCEADGGEVFRVGGAFSSKSFHRQIQKLRKDLGI